MKFPSYILTIVTIFCCKSSNGASLLNDTVETVNRALQSLPVNTEVDFNTNHSAWFLNNGNSLNTEHVRRRAAAFYATLPATLLEDAQLTVPEIIKKYGYPVESRTVTTSDGYILTMFRIPHGRKQRSGSRPVILLQHGLMTSSADFILSGPEKGLGYVMADAGYDVWMGNARGTRYSRNHTHLDPNSAEYWQFSWHEIAVHDVSAMIDYALATTKKQNLYYIGHSQGTTVFYVLCSEKPKYNRKIKTQFSLAPAANVSHMKNENAQFFARLTDQGVFLADLVGVYEVAPHDMLWFQLASTLCSDDSVTQILCTNSMFLSMGFNQKQMNASLIPLIMAHTPAGSSTRQLLHYGQEIKAEKFQKWDYGPVENKVRYGSANPPEYNISQITTAVYLLYSKNDYIINEIDVMHLCKELKDCRPMLVSDEKYNHLDYLYAMNARDVVYDEIIRLIRKG